MRAKLKFIILLFPLFCLLSTACTKNDLVGEFYLTDEMKNQNPYLEGQDVSFVDNNGDTILFVISKQNNIIEAQISSNSSTYNLFEEEKTSLKSDSISLQIKMYYEPHREPLLDFYIGQTNSYMLFNMFQIPLTYSNTPRVMSIEINGKWYYQVYYFENNYNQNAIIYYSTEYGILRVEFDNGDFIDYVELNQES
ncbi:MAG: hypothetical protein GXO88_14010 [Chlorobi bacterium]|nr:hypothetical protein [Chlorobiota bacterium]